MNEKLKSCFPAWMNTESTMFFLIAGPCVVESRDLLFTVADTVATISSKFNIPYIFKSSYRKANRSSKDSFTGIGDEKALE